MNLASPSAMSCKFLSVLVAFLLIFTNNVSAKCTIDSLICDDDSVFAQYNDTLIYGKVLAIDSLHNTIKFKSSDGIEISLPRETVATTRNAACVEKRLSFCPGNGTLRHVSGSNRDGVVLGVFLNERIVVSESGNKPIILNSAEVQNREITNADLENLVKQFSYLSHLIKLQNQELCPELAQIHQQNKNNLENCNSDELHPELDLKKESYFRALLNKGLSAPLEDFLILWNSESETGDGKNYFDDCIESREGNAPVRYENEHIVDPCKPDVLYSWGPKDKILDMEKAMPNIPPVGLNNKNAKWTGNPNPGSFLNTLFATLSPVSSYGYGHWPVRIKVKKGVNFRLSRELGLVDTGSEEETIWMSASNPKYDSLMNEFRIRSSAVIESWSYGTPEHYDEIVRDLRRLFSGKSFVPFVKDYQNPVLKSRKKLKLVERITSNEMELGKEEHLKKGLLEMIQMILNHEGQIYYAPGVCHSRAQHFATDRPTYFKGK